MTAADDTKDAMETTLACFRGYADCVKGAKEMGVVFGTGVYHSEIFRQTVSKHGICQSMNSAGGRCHDNARCESMWARMKTELLYDRYDTERLTVEELKLLVWRYFISYWNNRRICSANGGLPPVIKRRRYYESLNLTA